MINIKLEVMEKLVQVTELVGKVNTLLASVKNKYILTYIVEGIDSLMSNKVENIHTTHDEAYDDVITNNTSSPFVRYRETLKQAHIRLNNSEIIRSKDIEWINKNLLGNKVGFRTTPVSLKDENGKIIFKPIDAQKIPDKISGIINSINHDLSDNPILHSLDIHHRFEAVHPFYDGNGRTGRILLALLFAKYSILDIPASVISFAIAKDKKKYYKALQHADKGDQDTYRLLMLDLLITSFQISIDFIKEYKEKITKLQKQEWEIPEKYSTDLIEWLFAGVKTNNKFISKKMDLNNKTVSKYVSILAEANVIELQRFGKYAPYKNLILEKLINKYFAL